MYIPAHFEESRVEVLHELIRTHGFATLITMSSSGINANHIPFQLVQGQGQYGTLRGHIARANPIWRDLVSNVEALVIFQGPNGYITPSWYPTKQEHGKVVPTWNYVIVHAYGVLRFIDDPVWIKSQMNALTMQHEASFEKPWAVSDAPAEFINKMIESVIGVEISITRLIGKWKVSQNQPAANQAGVVKGLQMLDSSEASVLAMQIEKMTKND